MSLACARARSAVALTLVATAALSQPSLAEAFASSDIVTKAGTSVWQVLVRKTEGVEFRGSAFLIHHAGYFITADHVVDRTLGRGESWVLSLPAQPSLDRSFSVVPGTELCKVFSTDKGCKDGYDVALLKVAQAMDPQSFRVVDLDLHDNPAAISRSIRQAVLLGYSGTRELTHYGPQTFRLKDATWEGGVPADQGMSGGPVVEMDEPLRAIGVQSFVRETGYGELKRVDKAFSTPTRVIRSVIKLVEVDNDVKRLATEVGSGSISAPLLKERLSRLTNLAVIQLIAMLPRQISRRKIEVDGSLARELLDRCFEAGLLHEVGEIFPTVAAHPSLDRARAAVALYQASRFRAQGQRKEAERARQQALGSLSAYLKHLQAAGKAEATSDVLAATAEEYLSALQLGGRREEAASWAAASYLARPHPSTGMYVADYFFGEERYDASAWFYAASYDAGARLPHVRYRFAQSVIHAEDDQWHSWRGLVCRGEECSIEDGRIVEPSAIFFDVRQKTSALEALRNLAKKAASAAIALLPLDAPAQNP